MRVHDARITKYIDNTLLSFQANLSATEQKRNPLINLILSSNITCLERTEERFHWKKSHLQEHYRVKVNHKKPSKEHKSCNTEFDYYIKDFYIKEVQSCILVFYLVLQKIPPQWLL